MAVGASGSWSHRRPASDRLRPRWRAGALVHGHRPAVPGSCNWLAVPRRCSGRTAAAFRQDQRVLRLADGAHSPEGARPAVRRGRPDRRRRRATLTTISGSHPLISRWQLDGEASGVGCRAGHMVIGPYSYGRVSRRRAADGPITTHAPESGGVAVVQDTTTGDIAYRFDESVSDVGWARRSSHRASAPRRVVPHHRHRTREQVGKSHWSVALVLAHHDGEATRGDARRTAGSRHRSPKRRGRRRSWRSRGSIWISIAPDGDRIAVTHWRRWRRRRTGWTSEQLDSYVRSRSSLRITACCSTSRLLSVAQVCSQTATSSAWRQSHGSLRDRAARSVGTVPGAAGGLDARR